ncbi:hypothetical protein HPB51_026075 [Rhipicephalus microplus]|uniref:Uncharacterized protein n=1 Tax=Rhipicephalus microplus TaxID=6941 RepID=A0A9J6EE41_RHIMP|nr:hypothetical protein HPB51_026075 [Rhipicephalus microplus]
MKSLQFEMVPGNSEKSQNSLTHRTPLSAVMMDLKSPPGPLRKGISQQLEVEVANGEPRYLSHPSTPVSRGLVGLRWRRLAPKANARLLLPRCVRTAEGQYGVLVKQILPELTTQPGCAFQCVLNCSFPVDATELSAKILYKELVLQVEQQLEPAKVVGSLFDTSGDSEVNVLDSFAPPPQEEASPPPLVYTPAPETASALQGCSAPEETPISENVAAPEEASIPEAIPEDISASEEAPIPDVSAPEEQVQESQPPVEAGVVVADTAPPSVEPVAPEPKVTSSAAKRGPPPTRTSPPANTSRPPSRRGEPDYDAGDDVFGSANDDTESTSKGSVHSQQSSSEEDAHDGFKSTTDNADISKNTGHKEVGGQQVSGGDKAGDNCSELHISGSDAAGSENRSNEERKIRSNC